MTQSKTNIDQLKAFLTKGSTVRRAQKPEHTVILTAPLTIIQSSSPEEWHEDRPNERRFVLTTSAESTAKK